MYKKLISQAVKEKVGISKVVDSLKEAYDYIIVGAGASGNVLANRLSEDGAFSVLLLEAGGDDAKNPKIHIASSAKELQQTDFDYRYLTVPQKRACRGLKNKQAFIPRGKGLGGSGSINYLIYTRGSRHDFDEWEEMGCAGWSYKDVLPYFIKSEDNANADLVSTGYHGSGGPMKVADLQMTPLVESFLNSGRELGYDITDVNGPHQIGFSNMQGHVYEGMRWSTAHGYLRPIMDRPNLDVAIKSQVTKLKFADNRVTGVEVNKGGELFQVGANKEVIVSAGAIESPKILMLSGIGPRDHLQKLGIPVKANLPVGENFQDHPMCIMEYIVEKPDTPDVDSTTASQTTQDYLEYLFYTQGQGMPSPQGALAFMRTCLAPTNRLSPDILVHMSCSLVGSTHHKNWNFKDDVWDAVFSHDEKQHGIYLSSLLLHPLSVGSIRLHSNDLNDPLLIDPNFLDKPEDARVLVEGLKLQMQLGQTAAFQRIGAKLSPRNMPGSERDLIYSEDYLKKYVRTNTLSGNHASGTCKMGALSDGSAVVDSQLRVIGVEGLRVVDASIMPRIPSANTSAASTMIAEKAADAILAVNSVSDIKLPEDLIGRDSEKSHLVV